MLHRDYTRFTHRKLWALQVISDMMTYMPQSLYETLTHFPTLIGTCGVICVVIAYFQVQAGHWTALQWRLPFTNLLGACMILVSLIFTPNIPSIIIEIVWIAISLYGLARIWKHHKQNK